MALLAAGAAAAFLLIYLGLEAAGLGGWLRPGRWAGEPGAGVAATSFCLLAVDALLPVPASAVMVANGALFGLLPGAAVSAAGSFTASLLAFTLGRRLRGRAAAAGPGPQPRAAALLERWGAAAVLLSRPVPLLAETVALVAGAGSFDGRRFALASLLGALPAAFALAWLGAAAARGVPLLPLALVYLSLAAAAAWQGRRWAERQESSDGGAKS